MRGLPAGWGYLVVCGIESILAYLERFAFDEPTLAYLRSLNMFDERFVRMWQMYLAASIAAFNTGSLQLFQVVFTREENNDIPWTRSHLYQEIAN